MECGVEACNHSLGFPKLMFLEFAEEYNADDFIKIAALPDSLRKSSRIDEDGDEYFTVTFPREVSHVVIARCKEWTSARIDPFEKLENSGG
jgi:hypothetical protein